MAINPFWRGYLKLSLVTCAVAMTPAVSEAERVRFHTLNRATGNRVVSRYVDAESGKEVEEADQVKGYPRGDDEHVMLEDDEIAAVGLESARTIDIDLFVKRDRVEWVWYDRPHYLVPNDKVGEEAYSVIRDAMAATGMVGIARLVLYRRERAVMLVAQGNGIVVWTLRYGDEIRPEAEYFEDVAGGKGEAKAASLLRKLIAARTEAWRETMVDDPVQGRLLEIIAAKRKGRKRPAKAVKAAAEAAPAGNVVNIMDALKKSMAGETGKGETGKGETGKRRR